MWIKARKLFNEETGGEGETVSAGVLTEGGGPSGPAEDSTDSSVKWEDLHESLFEDETEGDEAVVDEPEAAEPATVEPAPTPAPPTPPAAPEPSQQTPSTPEATEPVAPQAPLTAFDPAEYQAWRSNRLTELETMYAFQPEEATALLTEPEVVLPKLAAKVHMEVLENAMRAMQHMVPVMMEQVQQHSRVNDSARALFVSVNPDLADPRMEPAIMQLGAVYRKVNPTASAQDASVAIGNLVRAALGMTAPQVGGTPPPVSQPNRQPGVVPFTPARGSGGASSPAAPSNPFEAMAREMEHEDW